MKKAGKLLIFLLSLCLMLPAVTSCKPDSTPANSTEESKAGDSAVKTAIDAMYVGEANRKGTQVCVTKDKEYKPSIEAGQSGSWTDTGVQLTDGIYGTIDLFKEPKAWVGFVQPSGMNIVVNLGGLVEGICEFETSHVLLTSYAINKIAGVSVYASVDGTNYNFVGSLTLADNAKDNNLYKYTLCLKDGIKATHLKYVFEGAGGWSFIDEIAAFKYEGEQPAAAANVKTLYPDCKMPAKVSAEELWASSEADYNTKKNLLAGLQPQIFSSEQLEDEYIKLNTDIKEAGMFTDGKYAASDDFGATEYFHMTRGRERTIVFDLTKTSSVSGYKLSFCYDKNAAVNLPTSLTVFGSADGENWYILNRTTDVAAKDGEKCILEGSFANAFKARFAAVTIPVSTHLYCDEIEITGTKNATAAKVLEGNAVKVTLHPDKYASSDKLKGVHDVVLMYNARNIETEKTEDLQKGLITEDESLTYVAYRDKSGAIKDYMFDSYLYLPFGAFDSTTAEGWHTYINNTFTQNYNVDALDKAVGKANEALGKADYKVKVFFSILRPNIKKDDGGNIKQFGDIDGDGKNEDFTKIADRIKCIKWEIDENLKLFKAGNYKNIELAGFYWFEEQISYEDPDELNMIKYAVDYVHGMNYAITWIPYFKSSGYHEWSTLGFDVACMQPNYFWKGSDKNIPQNAVMTKALGMCTEFEVDDAAINNNNFRARYKAYLKGGVDFGYMKDTIHMYYISGGHGALYDSYLSKNIYDHSIYDDTYKFIKGQLTITNVTAPQEQSFDCKANKTTSGKVVFTGDNTYLGLKYAPKYGKLTFSSDGTFKYEPLKDFVGEDSFYVYADNDYSRSDPVKITLKIV